MNTKRIPPPAPPGVPPPDPNLGIGSGAAASSSSSSALRSSFGGSVPKEQWRVGNEFLPYHPDASHVAPDYRDGWNDCFRAFLSRPAAPPVTAMGSLLQCPHPPYTAHHCPPGHGHTATCVATTVGAAVPAPDVAALVARADEHEKLREVCQYGSHLGIGGKVLAGVLDTMRDLRAALLRQTEPPPPTKNLTVGHDPNSVAPVSSVRVPTSGSSDPEGAL